MNEREIERWVRGRVYKNHGGLYFEPEDEITILDMGDREVTSIGTGPNGNDRVRRDSCGAEELLIDAVTALVKEAVAVFAVASDPTEDTEALEKRRASDRERKARQRTARNLILALAHRDGFTCSLCGEPMPDVSDIEVDHVIPVSKGGSDDPENLKLAHSRCNLKKGNRV